MPRSCKDDSEKHKPGRKGNFHGQCLQFLESFLPDWNKARINRTTGDFWSTVLSTYWKKFHWQLEHNEEPLGNPPMDENLTESELEKKAAAICLIEKVCCVCNTLY